MRPITITLGLGLLALCSAGLAAYYFPWPTPELTSERVNQPIFAEFDSKQVRTIEVIQFNEQRQALEKLLLERKGEKWTLPNFSSFSASNINRISNVINMLSDCRVLQLESDQQTDHMKYQVLDPDEPESINSPSGIGKKVALKDRNQKELGALIVGAALTTQDGQQKRLVRIPGEPQVYVVDFDATMLATQFRDWIDPNLMQVQTTENGPGNPFGSILVHHYRIDSEKLAAAEPQWNYRGKINYTGNTLVVESLEKQLDGTWNAVADTNPFLPVMQTAVSLLPQLSVANVRPKVANLSAALKSPEKTAAADAYQTLTEYGFKLASTVDLPLELKASGGDVVVTFRNGLRVTVYLGNVVPSPQSDAKLLRWVILVGSLDESFAEKPAAPQASDGAEVTEEQQRAFKRELELWEDRNKLARQAVEAFNQIHAAWYYAIDEDLIARLRPDLPNEQK